MGRLKDAHDKQREYAKKEYLSGDEAKGDMHSAKAEGFLDRILAGEDGPSETQIAAAAEPFDPTSITADPQHATAEIAAYLGIEDTDPSDNNSFDSAALLEATQDNPEALEALVLLGAFGTRDSNPDVDYSILDQFPVSDEPNAPHPWNAYQQSKS